MNFQKAPELQIKAWVNTSAPIELKELQGKVVLIKAFQMLCPGCVSHALPQATKVQQLFDGKDVFVLGLHSVFEHHEAQGTSTALKAFLHEYRIGFPVGIDEPSNVGNLPKTMSSYKMQGTPTTIIIDQQGRLRHQMFGHVDDMVLGAEIQALLNERLPVTAKASASDHRVCDSQTGCS